MSSRSLVNLLEEATGIATADLKSAHRVLAEFNHIGVVYHRFTRRFTVTLGGYNGLSYAGTGNTFRAALEVAFHNATVAR